MHSLTSMLKFKRKHGTESIKDFCSRFLHPTFGHPDKHGNYELVIGNNPKLCFAAHYDSVHSSGGMQKVQIKNDIVSLANDSDSNCLGADCATGIWLILEMIDAGIEGVYVVHAEEETGCIGSSKLVSDNPPWMDSLKAVISFDRKGKEDIITHQSGLRTCSDAFAVSLDSILGLGMRPDPTGSYTDSNEYSQLISECTNVSVGYNAQHTKGETQDLFFASALRDSLIAADWSKLVFERDPTVVDYYYDRHWGYPQRGSYRSSFDYWDDDGYYIPSKVVAEDTEADDFLELVCSHPQAVALLLKDFYGNPYDLVDELYEYGANVTVTSRLA